MNTFILAGGLGTRIQPLFPDQPKGMIRFREKPFLEHQMRLLARHGFRQFVFCIGYKADQIIEYFGDGSRFGWTIEYSVETTPRGTGGALRHAEKFFSATALVLNGDTYVDLDYRALVEKHATRRDAIGTIVVVTMADRARYGQAILDEDNRIKAFREKSAEFSGTCLVSAGVYVFEPGILEQIPSDQTTSLERDIFPAVLAAGKPLYGSPTPASFIDIGTPLGYERLRAALAK